VQVKEKAPYFELEKFILYISPRKLGAFDCKYESKICKFYYAQKIKNFRVSSSGQARGSVHPSLTNGSNKKKLQWTLNANVTSRCFLCAKNFIPFLTLKPLHIWLVPMEIINFDNMGIIGVKKIQKHTLEVKLL